MTGKKVFFVNDSSANPNWGCRATIFSLDKLIAHQGAEVSARAHLAELAHPNWQTSKRKQRLRSRVSQLTQRSSFAHKASSALLNRLVKQLADVAPKSWAEFESKANETKRGAIPDIIEAM